MLIVLGTKKRRRKRDDILDAVGVTLNAIRDSGDAFPPLKSAAACIVVILEMSQVRQLLQRLIIPLTCCRPQKIKSNREECERIAGKASKMLCEIWRQTKDYRDTLPQEIRDSINEIERFVSKFRRIAAALFLLLVDSARSLHSCESLRIRGSMSDMLFRTRTRSGWPSLIFDWMNRCVTLP